MALREELPPSIKPDAKYSIKQTCEILGICRETLRNYTLANVIKCGYRVIGERKIKFYEGREIKRFWSNNIIV